MSARPKPRLADADLAVIRAAIVSATSTADADKIVDRLWAKLEGDMQDRINVLIDAALGTVESKGKRWETLRRPLEHLRGREVAATSTKQLKEGPWHGR